MSVPLPKTLSSLRNHKDKTTMKTQVHAHNSLVKLKVISKRYCFGESFKTLHGLKFGASAGSGSSELHVVKKSRA
jgi:hypothetical protein